MPVGSNSSDEAFAFNTSGIGDALTTDALAMHNLANTSTTTNNPAAPDSNQPTNFIAPMHFQLADGTDIFAMIDSVLGDTGSSDAAVWFGPVQRALCLNPGLDLQFGSDKFLNLGLDLEGPVQQVRSR